MSYLDDIAAEYEIILSKTFIKDKFAELIKKISKKTQKKVVVLIDEYDKPIVEHIDDIEKATKNREIMRYFFGILKFSELNNVRDITFSRQFATLLGYTQTELETYFESYIQNLGTVLEIKKPVLLTKIKTWYNGYSWNAKDKMYNPFSILNLFMDQRFSNYWFATGTPTFLMKLIKNTELDTTEFENKKVSEILFDSYNLENLNIFVLLFQTGYLTISEINQKTRTIQYILNYPNFEVKQAFMTFLSFTKNDLGDIQPAAEDLRDYLENDDIEGFINIIRALFAKISGKKNVSVFILVLGF
ncbi:AAA family ATPase [Candidatus Marithrix sp. Canyon 246]|uniref:AAA family ATPase n=1 Tax=Candidatus Marithrix sp. Canyon 246 TaxID=1827136 RepID=UPI00084A0439|nr:AAA family ATPase [Candidatus Marithrix sp. Canyon 246]